MSAHPHARPPAQHGPKPRLADVLLAAKDHIANGAFSFHVRATLAKMSLCRSGEYGYAKLACNACGHEAWRPRGCGLRHCPSCGQTRADAWIDERKLEMLDCPYFQLVFSLPPALHTLAKNNQSRIYSLFFGAVRDTLVELARDPRHLGGLPQALLALHTWNGRLDYFLHIHAIMAGGAYDPAKDCWIPSRHPDFLFPVGVLSALLRGKFLAELKRLYAGGLLDLKSSQLRHLEDSATWGRFLDELYRTPFLTWVEKAVAGPQRVVEYLGHYLQRAGLSDRRILAHDDKTVTFLCKDRKKKHSTTGKYPRTLSLNDFVDLYAQHILPRGFHRVRFLGLWSPHHKNLLPKAREAVRRWRDAHPDLPPLPPPPRSTPRPMEPCPSCNKGPLELIDSVIYAVNWRAHLWSGLPRGPPRPLAPRRRAA
ncbi:MAG: transposase [Fimbriimonadaceae bacterium]